MGRWAQSRRRGGGGGAPSLPRLIAAADQGSGVLELTFDQDVTSDIGATPETGSLRLDGTPTDVQSCNNSSSAVILVQQLNDPTAGSVASWAFQPPWITTPIDLSSSALVT